MGTRVGVSRSPTSPDAPHPRSHRRRAVARPEQARRARAELVEVVADRGELAAPAFGIDIEQRVERTVAEPQPLEVEVGLRGRLPIGVSTAPARAVAAADHPLEHAQVVAEARPQELAVVALAEPVDVEDLRQLRAGLVERRASARSSRRSCSRRTASSPSGRGAPRRPHRSRRRWFPKPSPRRPARRASSRALRTPAAPATGGVRRTRSPKSARPAHLRRAATSSGIASPRR